MYHGNWNGNVCYKLTISGKGDYYSTGYQVLGQLNVTAQNRFYSGQTPFSDEGNISVAGQSGASPNTKPLSWTQQHNLVAENMQEFPTGYRQRFVEWRRGQIWLANGLEIAITPDNASTAWEAIFDEVSLQAFVPTGGGAILVDDTVRSGSYSRYAKVAPGTAESITAQSVDQTDQQLRLNHVFLHWTANGDTVLTPTLTYTAGASITWTATSVPKPMSPANRVANGGVDEYPVLSWDAHPSSNVTKFEVWRRIKDKVSGNGPQVRIAIVSSSVTSYTDYDVLITAAYDDFIAEYDVRSVYESGSYTSCSDPLYFAMVFGTEPQAKSLARQQKDLARATPMGFALDVSPNPFNPTATITFTLPNDEQVRMVIFDALGRQVEVIVDQVVSAGTHVVRWDGSGRASGTFYVSLAAGPSRLARRMVLMK